MLLAYVPVRTMQRRLYDDLKSSHYTARKNLRQDCHPDTEEKKEMFLQEISAVGQWDEEK